jgi:hypothetical protein
MKKKKQWTPKQTQKHCQTHGMSELEAFFEDCLVDLSCTPSKKQNLLLLFWIQQVGTTPASARTFCRRNCATNNT